MSFSSVREPLAKTCLSSAKPSRIDAFMKLISPFGILESARTGLMALPRSPLHSPQEEIEKEAEDLVDASSLPPG